MNQVTGKWAILKNEEILETDDDPIRIMQLAKKYDQDEITIIKVPAAR